MGKVAFDVLEMKRFQRDYTREKFTKSLMIIDKDDDMPEVLFKLFEQMRLMNDDLLNHLEIQHTKKKAVQDFEKVLMKDSDYQSFLDEIKKEDVTLKEISQKFFELTSESKRILDEIKQKSTDRKAEFGVSENDGQTRSNHHKKFPERVMTKLGSAIEDVSTFLLFSLNLF